MQTTQIKTSISRSPVWRGFLLLPLVLALFGLAPAPTAFGVVPAPDGGYPGRNTAEGDSALLSLTTGADNTAVGFDALFNNTTGGGNTAVGSAALFSNTTGGGNTANGEGALEFNRTGGGNTATGESALEFNTTGNNNTANGVGALLSTTAGGSNTATGAGALSNNTIGSGNTADGANTLVSNTTGGGNTANGHSALVHNTTGGGNIALGFQAGVNLTTGSNNIDIGNVGVAGEANIVRIGTQGTHIKTFIAGIQGSPITGTSVVVNPNGRLGTVASSQRFKNDIKPMDKASEAIHALKPVTFRYKQDIDPEGMPQFGLVAEEVAKVNPALVLPDKEGKPFTVRYDQVNAMLLNEFLKEHKAFVQEQHKVEKLEATVASLVTTVKEQASQIQKVSAQLEASKPAPQVVLNNQ